MSTHTVNGVTLTLQRGNIVDAEVDALVNAANAGLAGGGGVDGAIHRAGGPSIIEQCRKIGGCPTGSAVATTAGKLKARYIFHAVGPVYQQRSNDAQLLASTYQRCLELAEQHQLQSIAFPSISTGAYSYPIHLAAPIALSTILTHIGKPTSLQSIYFVLFDNRTYEAYQRALQKIIQA
jgi:O-acetyl-ADP-ribose deacetylase (regulator of RNase III)